MCISINKEIIEAICKYCEDKQICDNLSQYQDFYHKLKRQLRDAGGFKWINYPGTITKTKL